MFFVFGRQCQSGLSHFKISNVVKCKLEMVLLPITYCKTKAAAVNLTWSLSYAHKWCGCREKALTKRGLSVLLYWCYLISLSYPHWQVSPDDQTEGVSGDDPQQSGGDANKDKMEDDDDEDDDEEDSTEDTSGEDFSETSDSEALEEGEEEDGATETSKCEAAMFVTMITDAVKGGHWVSL